MVKRLLSFLWAVVLVSMMPLTALAEDVIADEHLRWAYGVLDAFAEARYECEGDMREYEVHDFFESDLEKKAVIVYFRQIKDMGLSLEYRNGALEYSRLSITSENSNADENRSIYTLFLRAALSLDENLASVAVSFVHFLYQGLARDTHFETLMHSSLHLDGKGMTANLSTGTYRGIQMDSLSLCPDG